MSSFTTPLKVEYLLINEQPYYKLLEEFTYYTDLIKNIDTTAFRINIPVDFITNFASIPKIFHWILSPAGRHGKASVVHDYMYYELKRQFKEDLLLAENSTDILIAIARMESCRELADHIFEEAMEVLEVIPWRENVMFTMVRLFGFNSIYKVGDGL